jgi:deoxyribodipyrimidine photo-lyase
MSRDQRVADNWALLHAQSLALQRQVPLAVVFTLAPGFLGATRRQYGFMLRGLRETAQRLQALAIPFFLLPGEPPAAISRFAATHQPGAIVTDFDPLRIKQHWQQAVAREARIALHEVDAHNIVPCRIASPKREFGAYTLRPRLHRLLREFLSEFPALVRHPFPWPVAADLFDPAALLDGLAIDRTVSESALTPGASAGRERLTTFITDGLARYDTWRNNPCLEGQSGLSPYLHFGQLAPQRVALAAAGVPGAESFLEELIVRRELADNFCLHTRDYDQVTAFPAWARETLAAHRSDRREYRYSAAQFADGATHDPLWNAAQQEMVVTGRMHGYLRMYWAKKILEWSGSAEEALATAIALNDRYQLDGRDPNGYAGIAWSIGGVHDRAWGERPVFGKIRYMNLAGCRRKFDVAAYIRRVSAP